MSRGTRVYVGNLPSNVRERDVEDIFRKFGKIVSLDLRTNKGPPFAFLDFDDSRDAEDAVRDRDGYDYDGYRIRVEYPRTYRGDRDGDRGRYGGGGRNGGGRYSPRSGGGGRRGDGGFRRSKYRINVTGLPPSGSWQDLKDHMREAGDVCYADVTKDGSGVVEFVRYEDMKYAVKKLDDTKFRSHEGETAYIRVKVADETSGGDRRSRSRSRSASRGRSRSRSRSPRERRERASRSPMDTNGKDDREETKRERSPSRSRSRSPNDRAKSRSKTPQSRSPSRSPDRD